MNEQDKVPGVWATLGLLLLTAFAYNAESSPRFQEVSFALNLVWIVAGCLLIRNIWRIIPAEHHGAALLIVVALFLGFIRGQADIRSRLMDCEKNWACMMAVAEGPEIDPGEYDLGDNQ